MATAKTPAKKTALKKAPVKAPAAKKAAAKAVAADGKTSSGHRCDYKQGARVKVKMSGSGKEIRTFVDHIEQTRTGPFIYCNIGTKDLPHMKGFRPAAVKGF